MLQADSISNALDRLYIGDTKYKNIYQADHA